MLPPTLVGANDEGLFWLPVRGQETFGDEDLLLFADGRYLTHLHERPASAGRFRFEQNRLTLEHWLGDRTLVLEDLQLEEGRMRGRIGATQVEFSSKRAAKP